VLFTSPFHHTATDPQFYAEMSDVTKSEKAELKRIAATQKARWAKIKAAKK
jgi:hypothetical protein